MTRVAEDCGMDCRERLNSDAVHRFRASGDQDGSSNLSEDEENVGMMSSSGSLKEEIQHQRCGKLGRFWTLHKGLILAFLSCVAQASGSIGVKMLAGRVPATEVAAFRLLGYFLMASLCMVYYKVPLRVTMKQLPWLVLRVVSGTVGICVCFYAYQTIPIGDTTAILFSSPIFTGIFAWILLGEKFNLVDAALAILALLGIVLIARPSFLFRNLAEASGDDNTMFGVIAAVFGAIIISTVFVILRKLGGISVHPLIQIWSFGAIGFFLASALTAILGLWVLPKCGMDRLVIIFVIVSGFLAQVFMTYAFKLERASYVAVMKSNTVILSFLLEFAFFGTVPFWLSIIGAVLVMTSSLGITFKKWKSSKSKKEPENEGTSSEGENEEVNQFNTK